jgi:hypothetical protein
VTCTVRDGERHLVLPAGAMAANLQAATHRNREVQQHIREATRVVAQPQLQGYTG